MQTLIRPEYKGNSLKNIDFVLWRVARAKEDSRRHRINRQLMDRPHDWGTTQH